MLGICPTLTKYVVYDHSQYSYDMSYFIKMFSVFYHKTCPDTQINMKVREVTAHYVNIRNVRLLFKKCAQFEALGTK